MNSCIEFSSLKDLLSLLCLNFYPINIHKPIPKHINKVKAIYLIIYNIPYLFISFHVSFLFHSFNVYIISYVPGTYIVSKYLFISLALKYTFLIPNVSSKNHAFFIFIYGHLLFISY